MRGKAAAACATLPTRATDGNAGIDRTACVLARCGAIGTTLLGEPVARMAAI